MKHPSLEHRVHIDIHIPIYIHRMTSCPQETNTWIWGPRGEIWESLTRITPRELLGERLLPASQFWVLGSPDSQKRKGKQGTQHKSHWTLSCDFGLSTLGFTWQRTSRQEVPKHGRGNRTWSLGRGKEEVLLHNGGREKYVWHTGEPLKILLVTPLPNYDGKWTRTEIMNLEGHSDWGFEYNP